MIRKVFFKERFKFCFNFVLFFNEGRSRDGGVKGRDTVSLGVYKKSN